MNKLPEELQKTAEENKGNRASMEKEIVDTLRELLNECRTSKHPEVIEATSKYLEACVKYFN